MPQYRVYRNLESSVRDHIKTELDLVFSAPKIDVRVGKTLNAKYKLPMVTVNWDSAPTDRLGIGDNRWIETNSIIIDIYATSEGLKLDLASLIVQSLREGIDCHTLSKDPLDQSKVIKTPSGSAHVTIDGNDPVDLGDSADKRDKFRHRISITIETVEL